MLSHKAAKLLLATRNVGYHEWYGACSLQETASGTFIRLLSQDTKLKPHSLTDPANFCKLNNYMAKENIPTNHTADDVGLMYTIPGKDYQRLVAKDYNTGAFTVQFQEQAKSLNEASLVIREPGVELVSYLRNADYSAPVNRYLIHGAQGSGKTTLLAYGTHYCMNEGWLVVPNYNLWRWTVYNARFRRTQAQEILPSTWNKERINVPHRAVTWLNIFKDINGSMLNDIKTTVKYTWSKHESSDVGTTFSALVDYGQARLGVATDVIGAIMKEVRLQDESTMPRTLVLVDGVNYLFEKTKLSLKHKNKLHMHELSYGHNLLKLISSTWSNGAVIAAFHSQNLVKMAKKNYVLPGSHPYDLLGQKGFDWLDPHIPIHVDKLTNEEVMSQLAYYKDKKWITGNCLSEAGEAEVLQLCYNNPADLAQICLSAF